MASKIAESVLLSTNLSNNARYLIRDGKYEEATKSLKSALDVVKQCLVLSQQQRELDPQREHCDDENECGKEQTIMIQQEPSSNNYKDLFRCFCGTYIYAEPILINHVPLVPTNATISTLTFVITLNLAMAHQLFACFGQPKTDNYQTTCRMKHLIVAKRLYELTFRMQPAEEVQSSLLITAAILNNLAMVHRDLGGNIEQSQCEQMLLSTIMLFVDTRVLDTTPDNNMFGNCPIDGFLCNVMHLIVKDSTTASAA